MTHRPAVTLCAVLCLLLLAPAALAQESVEHLVPEVLSVRPHATDAFTEGLILHDGLLYESTGQYGASSLRQVDLDTGEVLQFLRLPDQVFGEGLALVDDSFYQLTWRAQTAFRFNLSAFTEQAALEYATLSYEGEGWGLCYDGEHLWMSNGSDTLAARDPETFEVVDTLQVTLDGVPLGQLSSPDAVDATPVLTPAASPTPLVYNGPRLDQLNELECVDDSLYMNVWLTDYIFRVDKASGAVTGWIDASGLLTDQEAAAAKEMNGIVYLPDSETFLVTGKYWPKMFEVRFIPAE